MSEAVRELTFEEEYEILKYEAKKVFDAEEDETSEPPLANCVLRRALRCIKKLQKKYAELEEQGLLLRLPCKVGDNIYIIKPYGIEEASITGISEADDIDCFCFEIYIDPDCHEIIALEEFNDTWFLTKEEAEAKLKEMECSHE